MQNWVTSLQSAQQDVTASDLSAAGMHTDPLCSTSDCIFQCFQSGPLILMPPAQFTTPVFRARNENQQTIITGANSENAEFE